MTNIASSRLQASTASNHNAPYFHGKEIVFIDPNVDAIDILLTGLRPEVEAVLLDAVEPVPSQMAWAVEGRRGLEAIHVIAHGAPGEMRFAAGSLHASDLATYSAEFSALGHALSGKRALLLWGCQTGAGQGGAAFVEELAYLTGLDVAAATGPVGRGDWELDRSARAPLTAQGVRNYPGILSITVNLNRLWCKLFAFPYSALPMS